MWLPFPDVAGRNGRGGGGRGGCRRGSKSVVNILRSIRQTVNFISSHQLMAFDFVGGVLWSESVTLESPFAFCTARDSSGFRWDSRVIQFRSHFLSIGPVNVEKYERCTKQGVYFCLAQQIILWISILVVQWPIRTTYPYFDAPINDNNIQQERCKCYDRGRLHLLFSIWKSVTETWYFVSIIMLLFTVV